MVAIRLHRFSGESLTESDPQTSVTRVSYETAAEQSGSGAVSLHRFAGEVLAKSPARIAEQRISYETAAAQSGSGAILEHRFSAEILIRNAVQIAVQRMSYETAAPQSGSGAISLHRFAGEMLARTGVPNPTPISLAADIEFFLHNWVDEVEIETAYETDVIRSPDTLAEERRSLYQRPQRTMTLRWLRQGKSEVYQLRLLLRRLTGENLQVPLYPDVQQLSEDAASNATQIFLDTRDRRFFVGARVLFFPTNTTYITRTDVHVGVIQTMTASWIEIGASLGVAMTAGSWSAVPLLDCEILLDPAVTWETAEVGNVQLEVREIRGKSALPPMAVGVGSGFPRRLGRPIFEIEPNWLRGIKTTYRRYGSEQRVGRRLVPLLDGGRYVQVQDWDLAPVERSDWYRIAAHFDTRRGRAESFWVIDREFSWTVANTTSIFVDIVPFGRFVDFDQIWTESNIAVAIRMKSGEIHLMQVNSVSDNGSFWRLTAVGGQTIEDPIDLSQIDFVARARISRFDTDAMREVWKTNNVCEIRLRTVETPNEKTVDF